ncbi:transporter substrate-binding domain-containing protein [Christensenellaceae bacterium OttesenSCG-928-L17]|nr:transporter substrate-binding domain-containing protein [Christensenellaceae bacterium OttesenSCG-928-L17]
MFMRLRLRVVCIMLVVVLVCAACAPISQASIPASTFTFTTYQEIPGVTQAEIDAIEAIKATRSGFVYGMNYTTETFRNAVGEISGFSRLYCDWLGDLFGISFSPAIYEWGDLVDGMQTGEIDFSGELTRTEEREKTYYMTSAIADRNVNTFRLAGAMPLDETAQTRALRYAFLEGTTTYPAVRNAADEEFEAVFVNTYEEAVAALIDGSADMFFDDGPAEAALDQYGNIVSSHYYPPIYVPVSLSTQNEALAPFISVMQKALDAGALVTLISLYNQGQEDYLKYKLFTQFTDEELLYIQEHSGTGKAIPVVMEYDNYPASFYNYQDEAWQGIAVDVMDRITDLTDLKFTVLNEPGDEWYDIFKMLETGDAAMITELLYSENRSEHFLWTDEPYAVYSYALLSLSSYEDLTINQIAHSRVGVVYETAYADVFLRWFPDHKYMVECMTTDEGFDALESGEIDLLMGTTGLLLSATNYMERPHFKANIIFDYESSSSFGFNKNETLLRSIISKAQRVVDTNALAVRWTNRVYDYNTVLAQERMSILLLAASVLLVTLVVIGFLYIKNRNTNKNLGLLVEARTAELAVQTEAAQSASRAKGDFLARMSHEIRTPLNAIIGMAHIAHQSSDPATQESIDQIIKASSHLLGILNDVLDMSKIEAGKFELSEEPFALLGAMEEIHSIISQRCKEKNVTFDMGLLDIPDINIVGDKLRLSQVLINLLGNAVKFTEADGRVGCSVRVLDQDGERIHLSFMVMDDGIGMTEEQISHLFIPFEQADQTISSRFGGTGLGLAISQNLVKQMGGEITVHSVMDEGSRFMFDLSFATAGEVVHTQEEEDTSALDFTGKRILVAEDIEINRYILRELLSSTHLSIDEAENGAIAVQMFENSAPGYYALVLMDIQMPELDGYSASTRVRALAREDAKTVPIIAMTANAYREDVERAYAAGMNAHLAKPIDIGEVLHTLAQFLLRD